MHTKFAVQFVACHGCLLRLAVTFLVEHDLFYETHVVKKNADAIDFDQNIYAFSACLKWRHSMAVDKYILLF